MDVVAVSQGPLSGVEYQTFEGFWSAWSILVVPDREGAYALQSWIA